MNDEWFKNKYGKMDKPIMGAVLSIILDICVRTVYISCSV